MNQNDLLEQVVEINEVLQRGCRRANLSTIDKAARALEKLCHEIVGEED